MKNQREQRTFIRELCHRVQEEVISLLDANKIPIEWDGHELRQLLADKFADAASMSTCMNNRRDKRRRDYDAVVLERRL